MSMTLEEAIKLLKQYQGYDPMFPDGETLKHAFDLTDETGERAKKATPEIVEAIRAEYVPYDREHSTIALGKKYGIDPAYVWRIINGQKRKRLP